MTRARRGFTLWEMTIVLAILAIVSAVAAPAFARLGTEQPRGSADALLGLLHDARKLAIERNVTVTLRVDPLTGRFRADSVGMMGGAGEIGEGSLGLGATESFSTDLPRVQYVFQSTGAAFADSVIVRGGTTPLLVAVDPWSGVVDAAAIEVSRLAS